MRYLQNHAAAGRGTRPERGTANTQGRTQGPAAAAPPLQSSTEEQHSYWQLARSCLDSHNPRQQGSPAYLKKPSRLLTTSS
jgi:hypothetical protein